jgi:subtilase family serine protease
MFQRLGAVGIPIFVSAGDWGADAAQTDGKTHVVYPGSDPWVTSCGGTVLTIDNTGKITQEKVWSDAFSSSSPFGSPSSDFGATGGGANTNFLPVPTYQTAAGITQITDSNSNVLIGRFVPDVAGMVACRGLFVNGALSPFQG